MGPLTCTNAMNTKRAIEEVLTTRTTREKGKKSDSLSSHEVGFVVDVESAVAPPDPMPARHQSSSRSLYVMLMMFVYQPD